MFLFFLGMLSQFHIWKSLYCINTLMDEARHKTPYCIIPFYFAKKKQNAMYSGKKQIGDCLGLG